MSTVGQAYGKAFFATVVSSRRGMISSQLSLIAQAISRDVSLAQFFANPSISEEAKSSVISDLAQAKIDPELVAFLRWLVGKGRISSLLEIANFFTRLVDEELGILRGEVFANQPVAKEVLTRLEAELSEFTRRKVQLEPRVDTSAVEGIMAKVSGWTFDDTAKFHLQKLQDDMNRRSP